MLSDVEVSYAAPTVSQDHQHQQDSKRSSWDGEEINRNQLVGVIFKDGLPAVRRRFSVLRKQPRDGALRNLDSQFQEFPVNARCSPEADGYSIL
jgi:hypothetical protein